MSVYGGDSPENFRTAIESVLDQKFTKFVNSRVYLAIDGPVSAELEEQIRSVEPRLHRVIRIMNNGGLANALNTLICHLEDEQFVFRMDADDVSLPTRYQCQLDYFAIASNIDVLGTNIIEVDCGAKMRREVKFARGSREARERLGWRAPVAHPTVCFRRHVLTTTKGYPNVPFNEDIALWFRCAELGFIFGNVQKPLYQFTIDEGFWKRRSLQKAFWEWRCYVLGGFRLDGLSWKLLLPTIRLILRLSPLWLQKWAYKSKFRRV